MLGERYYRFNKYCLFEHSVRVPLVLAGTVVPRENEGNPRSSPGGTRGYCSHDLGSRRDPWGLRQSGRESSPDDARKAAFCSFYDPPATAWFMWRTADRTDPGIAQAMPAERLRPSGGRNGGRTLRSASRPREWHNLYAQPELRAVRDQMGRDLLIPPQNIVALKRPSIGPGANRRAFMCKRISQALPWAASGCSARAEHRFHRPALWAMTPDAPRR